MKTLPLAELASDPLLTRHELAQRLNLKPRAIDGLMAERRIPAIRLSPRRTRYRWADVARVLESSTIPEAKQNNRVKK